MIEPHALSSKNEFEIDTTRNPVERIIAFLDKKLPDFPEVFLKKTAAKKIKAEVKISQELCVFLNTYRQDDEISLFLFQTEWNYEDARSSDFAVIDVVTYHSSTEPTKPFFYIEAKRLPTTGKDKKTGQSREREYVEGNLGGMERYKRGHHGDGLPDSSIIGYIQKQNFKHWHGKINEWIQDLIDTNKKTDIVWNDKDLLVGISDLKSVQKYRSKNTRIVNSQKDSITLHHYLIDIVQIGK